RTRRQRSTPNHSRGHYFFFSSRRRHTRWPRDWSSDVCSSDLCTVWKPAPCASPHGLRKLKTRARRYGSSQIATRPAAETIVAARSEERRVGKECRAGWGPYRLRVEEVGIEGMVNIWDLEFAHV